MKIYIQQSIRQQSLYKCLIIAWCSLALNFLSISIVKASENDINLSELATSIPTNENFLINLNADQIKLDYNFSAFNDQINVFLASSTLASSTDIEIVKINEKTNDPWQLKRVSPVFQFNIKNELALDRTRIFKIQLTYADKDKDRYKEIFFFDKAENTWRPLPTKDYLNFAEADLNLPFAKIALFSYPDILSAGKASWYKYRNGDFSASPDFAKGSILKVINLDNGKTVNVTINDWGPDRYSLPNRVVDLDRVAFSKIASTSKGVINVRIEPIYIASSTSLRLGLSKKGAEINPIINSKAAIILAEEDNRIIYQKNSTTTLPIASLTKLIAIKTFFDTKPSLNTIVTYLNQDEKNNLKYVNKAWRSERLDLKEGDKLSLENLVYASLIGSYNNAVETIVRASGLKRDEFIELMNKNVISWGASHTHFIEPTGLAKENVSTAEDYAIITKELFLNPLIKKASTMGKYQFTLLNGKKKNNVINKNSLILKNIYKIDGSKTGYLDEAGYCLMTRVRMQNNKHITIVVLGASTREQTFSEVEKLIQYGLIDYDKIR